MSSVTVGESSLKTFLMWFSDSFDGVVKDRVTEESPFCWRSMCIWQHPTDFKMRIVTLITMHCAIIALCVDRCVECAVPS